MKTILWILLIASAVIFILKLIFQMGRIRRGNDMHPGRLGVVFNWVLIIVFIGSLGGLIYGFVNPDAYQSQSSKPSQAVSSSSSSSSSSSTSTDTEADRVTWSPKNARLNDNGEAKVRFDIPAGYRVRIVGHKYGSDYKTFKRVNHDRTVKYTFEDAGKYDIICTAKNGHKKTYHLRIRNANSESSSSNSSSSSSNSSSSSSSRASSSSSRSNRSSSNNNNNSGSNGSNSSNNGGSSNGGGSGSSNGGGSRSSNAGTSGGGGGSSYRATNTYRPAQRSTGGGGSYTPSRPVQQAPQENGGPVGPGY